METPPRANPSQQPACQLARKDRGLRNQGSMVYKLCKPEIWLINPEQGPSHSPVISPWGSAGKLQKKAPGAWLQWRTEPEIPGSTRLCWAWDLLTNGPALGNTASSPPVPPGQHTPGW